MIVINSSTKQEIPFWSLPKRAPKSLEFNPENKLHCRFIASAACLRATVFNIEMPFKKVSGRYYAEIDTYFENAYKACHN